MKRALMTVALIGFMASSSQSSPPPPVGHYTRLQTQGDQWDFLSTGEMSSTSKHKDKFSQNADVIYETADCYRECYACQTSCTYSSAAWGAPFEKYAYIWHNGPDIDVTYTANCIEMFFNNTPFNQAAWVVFLYNQVNASGTVSPIVSRQEGWVYVNSSSVTSYVFPAGMFKNGTFAQVTWVTQ